MTNQTCRCGRPTRDAAYSCDECSDLLARSLGDVPWLADELETTISRQRGVDYRTVGGGKGGKKPAEMPSPANMGASEARTHLKALLVSWALFSASEGIRHREASDDLPADNLPALSRWLLCRVDGLALHEIGPDAVEEITSAVAHCHRLIDRPTDRQYLGTCPETECPNGRLYGRPGSDVARCDDCATPQPADVIREKLLAELDDRLCTAAEIAHLSTYLGLKAGRDQVRKRINQWHVRGLLAEAASLSDQPTFRFGSVYAMLVGAEYGTRRTA